MIDVTVLLGVQTTANVLEHKFENIIVIIIYNKITVLIVMSILKFITFSSIRLILFLHYFSTYG